MLRRHFHVSGIPETRYIGGVEEGRYRQSRLCRLFGNPVAFAVVQLLADNKELSPSEIARAVGRSVQRVSTVLGTLRLAEVVRYETDGKRSLYRLKHPSEMKSVLRLFPVLSRRLLQYGASDQPRIDPLR